MPFLKQTVLVLLIEALFFAVYISLVTVHLGFAAIGFVVVAGSSVLLLAIVYGFMEERRRKWSFVWVLLAFIATVGLMSLQIAGIAHP